MTTPGIKSAIMSPGSGFFGGPFPNSSPSKRRSSISKINGGGGRGKSRGKKSGGGQHGFLGGYVGVEEGFESLDSPMSDVGGDSQLPMNGLAGDGDEVSSI